MNKERQKILRMLMHTPTLTFNRLWNKEGPSNKFAYHVKVLEEDGLIKKSDGSYQLTHEGKKYATYIEGDTGKKSKPPLVGVIIVVVDEKEDKFLMMQRKKEPFYGYWGFHGGKLKFSQYIMDCACEELAEETGLECDLELKGLFSSKTFNNEDLAYSHQLFVVKATKPRGTLLEKTREGINQWVSRDEISSLKTFPNIMKSVKIVSTSNFSWVEADRFQENDEFIGMDVLHEKEF